MQVSVMEGRLQASQQELASAKLAHGAELAKHMTVRMQELALSMQVLTMAPLACQCSPWRPQHACKSSPGPCCHPLAAPSRRSRVLTTALRIVRQRCACNRPQHASAHHGAPPRAAQVRMQQAQQHTKDLEAIQQLADRFKREAEQAQAAAASARADAEQARCEAEQARCEGAMAARRAEQAEEGLRMAKEQVTGSLIAPDCN